MNIAMLLETLSFNNGVSRVVLALTEQFVKRGHQVHLYSTVNRLPEGGRALFSDPNIRFHWLPSLRGSWRAWSLPLGALLPVLGLPMLNRLPPRLPTRAGAFAGRRHDVVVSHAMTVYSDVIQMHNDPQPTEHEKLARVPFAVDPPKLEGPRKQVRAAVEKMRFAPGRYKSVVAHSNRSASEIEAAYGIPRSAIDVIPHGVDSDYFSPLVAAGRRVGLRRRLGLTLQDVVFLYVGDSWKGLEFAIQGLARLPKTAPVSLLAAGPYPKEAFARFAREYGVRLIQEELWDDVRSLYSVADALVNPTPLDTFFLVGLEAMAMRLPLITTQFAGVSELLTHGKEGFILESPSDPEAIAEACRRLLQADVRLRMAEHARQFAVSRTWEQAALGHLRHYAGLRDARAGFALSRAV